MHTHQIEEATEEDEEDDDEYFGVHKVSGNKRYKKLVTTLTVGRTLLEFEVDTGLNSLLFPLFCIIKHYHIFPYAAP